MIRKFKMPFNTKGYAEPIRIPQYDTGYEIAFDMTGLPAGTTTLSGYNAVVEGTRADGLAYEFPCTITGTEVSFTVDTTCTGCPGRGEARIRFLLSGEEIAAHKFIMEIEKSPVPDDAVDADVAEARALAAEIQAIVDNAAARAAAEAREIINGYSGDVDSLKTEFDKIRTATAEDIGKALMPKTIVNGKVVDWEFGYAEVGEIPTIDRDNLSAALEAILKKAETAMQPSVYDTLGLRTDIFQYAKGRADSVQENLNNLINEIHAAYTINDGDDSYTYNNLHNSMQGLLSLIKAYVQARLVEYKAFTITIVNELPVAGQAMTFYLMPKDGGGYDKWWWITDSNGNGKWDVFGSATTLVVDALPQTGDEDADYILKTTAGCLYYKWFDNDWHMVAGSLAETVNELPETGNVYTDYYCPNAAGTYVHYRWINGAWHTIGSDAYTKTEVDDLLTSIRNSVSSLSSDLGTTNSNLASLSRTVERVAQDLANLDTEGYTYEAALTQEGDTYTFTLYENDGEEQTIKSQFVLPSGGGGGGSSSTTQLEVEKITPSPVVCTPTDKVEIQINYSSTDTDGELVDGTYTWRLGTTTIAAGSLVQGTNTFDLTEHCSVGTQKLILTVTDEGGSVAVKSWTVQIVDVRLESAFSDRYTNPLGRSVNFTYTPYGAVSKTVHFKLDGVELESVVTSASGTLQSYTLSPQTHGAHLLECWITATVNSTAIETEHIFKDIIWYDESSSLPVIGCAYRYDHYGQVSARQYDTTRISYVVYDPSTSTPAVTLAVDGATVNQLVLTEALNTWAYKADDVAVHVLTITCRGASVEIRVNVHELGYDVSPVTANLEFDFDPIGRSNTSDNRLWHDENHPEVAMTVSDNFDWQNGGYKIDNEGNQYFCVKAGSRAYISYDLFGTDPVQAGAEFKVIFKTSNVRDNTTSFLTCLPEDTVKVGLDMKAHAAYLKTSTDELYMPYSEEDVIEYDLNP